MNKVIVANLSSLNDYDGMTAGEMQASYLLGFSGEPVETSASIWFDWSAQRIGNTCPACGETLAEGSYTLYCVAPNCSFVDQKEISR